MFEPFVRVGGRGRSHGSGIGLFAARRMIDAIGGRIFLERNGYASSRFASSRFAMAWPLTPGRSHPAHQVLTPPGPTRIYRTLI